MPHCATCQQPIDLRTSFLLKFPKHVRRICDDCALVMDHVTDPVVCDLSPVRTGV